MHPTEPISVTVGHDKRYGAEMLAQAVAVGIRSAGCDVFWLGQVPTGLFSYATAGRHWYRGPQAGVLVTGSHMPPERIGIIPMNADGTYCTADVTVPIETSLLTFPENQSPIPLDHIGSWDTLEGGRLNTFARAYLQKLVHNINATAIKERRYRVLIDPGNGTMGEIVARLLKWLGCESFSLNFQPKPVPDRPSECRPSSCTEAMAKVRELKCDIGFCFDGDGDRILVLDENGNAFPEDIVGAFLAKAALKAGDVCVATVDASALIDDVCAEIGARVVRCKIGQPATGAAIKEHDATFCYEPSAKYGWPKQALWYDGLIVVGKVLELMATTKREAEPGIKASELSAGLVGRFFKRETGLALPAGVKEDVVRAVFTWAREEFEDDAEISEVDGLRIVFPDNSWLLLRPSGTEPKARIYADSRSAERTDELIAKGEDMFRTAIDRVR